MEKINLYRVAAIASIAIILLISVSQSITIFAQPAYKSPASALPTTPALVTDSVNAVAIRAVFHFSTGAETVDSFKEFQTLNPFAPSSANQGQSVTPSFVIRGVVSWDRPHLYENVDKTYDVHGLHSGDSPQFDIDVWFHRGDQYYRGFDYQNCRVTGYDIDTLRDNDKPYTTKIGGGEAGQKFVYRESFTFQCNGLSYVNAVLEKMKADELQKESDKTDQLLREKFPERYK